MNQKKFRLAQRIINNRLMGIYIQTGCVVVDSTRHVSLIPNIIGDEE